jgi:hypothetical protein
MARSVPWRRLTLGETTATRKLVRPAALAARRLLLFPEYLGIQKCGAQNSLSDPQKDDDRGEHSIIQNVVGRLMLRNEAAERDKTQRE